MGAFYLIFPVQLELARGDFEGEHEQSRYRHIFKVKCCYCNAFHVDMETMCLGRLSGARLWCMGLVAVVIMIRMVGLLVMIQRTVVAWQLGNRTPRMTY